MKQFFTVTIVKQSWIQLVFDMLQKCRPMCAMSTYINGSTTKQL